MSKALTEALRKLPHQEILALAKTFHAISCAQVAAGKKLTPHEQEIMDKANAFFNPPPSRKTP